MGQFRISGANDYTFGDIRHGDCCQIDGYLYMAVASPHEQNAVCLETGITTIIDNNREVISVTVTATIREDD